MSFLDWARQCNRKELQRAATVGAVALALIAWTLVPAGRHSRSSDAVAAGLGPAGRSVSAQGSDEPGTSPDGAQPGGADSGSSGSNATTVAGSSNGTSPGDGVPCADRAASDQGVTPDEVLIGVGNPDVAGPAGNAAFGIRRDIPQIVSALVDDINAHGGVACRTLVAKLYPINPFDSNDQKAKCLQAVEADKIFAFLDPGMLATESTQRCVTHDHGVPLLSDVAYPIGVVQRQSPYFLSPNTVAERVAKDWVYRAQQAGFFDPSQGFAKLGLLDDSCFPDVNDAIKRDLADVGVTAIDERTLSCSDLVAPPNEVAQYALDHKLAHVTHVFPATSFVNIQVYLEAAHNQDFHPKYGASDILCLTCPGVTDNYNADEWDGTIAYTTTRSGELNNGQPSPETVRCDAVLVAHGVPGIKAESDDFARVYCDLLHLFTAVMTRSPPNPTRLSFAEAIQDVGQLPFSGVSDGVYGAPGKTTGADFIRPIQWYKECHCWKLLDPTFQLGY